MGRKNLREKFFTGYSNRIVLVLLILCVILLVYLRPRESRVFLGDNCFYVELADTPVKHTRGLMFRKELPLERGMLFIFTTEQRWPFYMKNTFIPLDIIWINKKKEVVFIKKNAQPCLKEKCPTIYPNHEAMYALEINAGIVDNIGLKIGDKVVFDLR